MLYILLPTLLTVGLLSWAIDEFGGDDNNDNEPEETGPTKELDPSTGMMVVKLNDDPNAYTGDQSAEQIFGYRGNDDVSGGGGNDALNLGEGADTGTGGEGTDRIFGNAGNDLMNGGANETGRDFVSGGAGNDTVVSKDYKDVQAEVTGPNEDKLLSDLKLPANAEAFMAKAGVTDAGDDYLQGNGGNDILIDTAGKNLIEGGAGNDYIVSLDKNGTDTPDVVAGGSGDDTIIADDGDKVNGGLGNDTFRVSVMEATDKPVQIQDYQRGETLQIQIDTEDNQVPQLNYALKNGIMSVSVGEQVLVTLQAKEAALVQADIAKIQGNIQVNAV